MSGQWSGGAANRHWGRPGSRLSNVPGDAERGPALFAELQHERFWCDNCGAVHPLIEHRQRNEVQKPSVGRVVHYVSFGTPGGEYSMECRSAIITEVGGAAVGDVGLAVLNPEGLFFRSMAAGGCHFDAGEGKPGKPDCPAPHENGPHRYCACGWTEAAHVGGTWHWPERVES